MHPPMTCVGHRAEGATRSTRRAGLPYEQGAARRTEAAWTRFVNPQPARHRRRAGDPIHGSHRNRPLSLYPFGREASNAGVLTVCTHEISLYLNVMASRKKRTGPALQSLPKRARQRPDYGSSAKCQCTVDYRDDGCSNRFMAVECHDEICGLQACSNRYKGDDGVEVFCTERSAWASGPRGRFVKASFLRNMKARAAPISLPTQVIVRSSGTVRLSTRNVAGGRPSTATEACSPNCQLSELVTKNSPKVFIVAGQTILPGDEVTIPYG